MRIFRNKALSGVLCFVAVAVSAPDALAAPAVEVVEVVESVPVETTLAVPGLRNTPEVWAEMIGAAGKTIDLEEFYVYSKAGEALDPVLGALRAAAGRGVKIRLLIDPKFYGTYPAEPDELSRLPNIEVRTIDFSALGGIQHSKYFVVDGKDAFVGSANFDWVALTHVHEIGLRIKDAVAAGKLESVFAVDWKNGAALGGKPEAGSAGDRAAGAGSAGDKAAGAGSAGDKTGGATYDKAAGAGTAGATSAGSGDKGARKGVGSGGGKEASKVGAKSGAGLTIIASPPGMLPAGVGDTLSSVVDLIAGAKSQVRVQVYEYSTHLYRSTEQWHVLDNALRDAASRGVHVQLLVDKKAMKEGGADLKALAQIKNFDVRIVTIPEWSGGHIPYARLVHSKYMICDGQACWVGSENWSGNYFTSSRNVGVVVRDARVAGQLGAVFDKLWESGYVAGP